MRVSARGLVIAVVRVGHLLEEQRAPIVDVDDRKWVRQLARAAQRRGGADERQFLLENVHKPLEALVEEAVAATRIAEVLLVSARPLARSATNTCSNCATFLHRAPKISTQACCFSIQPLPCDTPCDLAIASTRASSNVRRRSARPGESSTFPTPCDRTSAQTRS
jgi:hypothetical protein